MTAVGFRDVYQVLHRTSWKAAGKTDDLYFRRHGPEGNVRTSVISILVSVSANTDWALLLDYDAKISLSEMRLSLCGMDGNKSSQDRKQTFRCHGM